MKGEGVLDPHNLHFGQQHCQSVQYFQERFQDRWTRIPMSQSPHAAFVAGDVEAYVGYLHSSWRHFYDGEIPSARITEYVDKFHQLVATIKEDGSIKEPIEVFRATDGALCVAHGNHRSVTAMHLGVPLPAVVSESSKHAAQVVAVPEEIYGTGHRNMPYQTIYSQNAVLVEGRRTDLLDRLGLICSAISLKGKSIIDFGCNYGMSTYLALTRAGARSAHLVEGSKDVLSAAVRLAVILNNAPTSYTHIDLREPSEHLLPDCDIGFCFSITAYVGDIKNLVRSFQSRIREALVYESHEGREVEPEIRAVFSKCTEIGQLGTRRLYLLIR